MALCGPPSRPCRVVADETVATAAVSAWFALDGSGQPAVLYRVNDTSFAGSFARRTPSGWVDAPTPFSIGLAAPAFDPAGVLHAIVATGADTTLRYTSNDGAGWQPLTEVVGDGWFGGALWAPGPGCLLGAVVERSNVDLLQKNPTFALTTLTGDGIEPSSALAADGRPELTWFDGQTQRLTWQAPPDAPETLPAPPPNERTGAALLAVVGEANGVGEPHLLYPQGIPPFESDPGTSYLVHSVRAPDGTWTTATVVQDALSPRCFYPSPPPPGTTCTSRDTVHQPTAVIASDNGDVRLLYLTVERETDYTVDANGRAGSTTSTLSATLDMAWPDGAGFGTTTLVDAAGASTAGCGGGCAPVSAAVDAGGTIHVVIVGPTLRYVALAP